MKILLLGDFSSFHKNLKEGLTCLGHDVTLASSGDNWKSIERDVDLNRPSRSMMGKIIYLNNIVKALPRLTGYDIVQFMSPVIFSRRCGLNKILIQHIFNGSGKFYLAAAGATSRNSFIADYLERKYKYPQLYKAIKKQHKVIWSQSSKGREYNDWFHEKLDGVIPIMYEYAQAYREVKHPKLLKTQTLPLNFERIQPIQFSKNIPIQVFHGLNNEEAKGTELIIKAMKTVCENNRDVDFKTFGRLPIVEYLGRLNTVSVVIDQLYSVSPAMNALYAMAQGKVVMGGGEEEYLKEHGLSSSPMIPLKPSYESIVSTVVDAVSDLHALEERSYASRRFVEENHCHIRVAQNYLDAWRSS